MSTVQRPEWSLACARAAAEVGQHGFLRFLGLVGLVGLGCRATDGGPPTSAGEGWSTHVVHEAGSPLCSVAAGDVDLAAPGDEVVAVGPEGELVYLAHDGAELRSERMGDWGDGVAVQLVQVAIGDVDRTSPGAEIVVVGARMDDRDHAGKGEEERAVTGVAWLFVRSAEGFTRTEIYAAAAPLYAVLVADLDPAFAGQEIALAGADREVVLLVRTADGLEPRTIASLPAAARAMAATEAGLVVACDDGSLVWLARPMESGGIGASAAKSAPWLPVHTWHARTAPSGAVPRNISEREQRQSTDRWSRSEGALTSVVANGGGVLACGADGRLRLFQLASVGQDVAFVRETRCLASAAPLGGAAFADVDLREPGDEAAAVAEDGQVHVVRLTPWPVADDVVPASADLQSLRVRAEVVAGDSEPLRAIAAGRFLPFERDTVAGAGSLLEGLVCVGDSGRVLVVVHTDAATSTP